MALSTRSSSTAWTIFTALAEWSIESRMRNYLATQPKIETASGPKTSSIRLEVRNRRCTPFWTGGSKVYLADYSANDPPDESHSKSTGAGEEHARASARSETPHP